ncbi:hypothetical protein JDO7802_03487 [Jannaschia donghaensis]|uniref:Uncharacterized protein n=1 Tax=Jannaschia donghaensis TaxID=420998 RepID=A0A0M6YQC5_9RHOB|nr:hypothetical protein JDO7802_03487 [Jannaschia donghaensis]
MSERRTASGRVNSAKTACDLGLDKGRVMVDAYNRDIPSAVNDAVIAGHVLDSKGVGCRIV